MLCVCASLSAGYRGLINTFVNRGRTEEMNPRWFAIPSQYLSSPHMEGDHKVETLSDIPLEKMWPDDELWMPLLLRGQYFVGRVDFGIANDDKQMGSWAMEKWWFGSKAENV